MRGWLRCDDWAPCVRVQIREYEQVIIEDRMEKEKTRKKMEQDDLELKSIVKVGCARGRGRAGGQAGRVGMEGVGGRPQALCSTRVTKERAILAPAWAEEVSSGREASFQP